MPLELHIFGPAYSLPSIDPSCLATVAYMTRAVPRGCWVLVGSCELGLKLGSSYEPSFLPYLLLARTAEALGIEGGKIWECSFQDNREQ